MGFDVLFRGHYPDEAVDALLQFSKANGGISRYVKIRYFFERLLQMEISEDQISGLAAEYSLVVKQQVIDAPAVTGSLEFLAEWQGRSPCVIVSGSDEIELNEVCISRGIAHYFSDIFGSPRSKIENFIRLFDLKRWQPDETLFIGDTKNDHEAAVKSGVHFIARDSGIEKWNSYTGSVLRDLSELENYLDKYIKG